MSGMQEWEYRPPTASVGALFMRVKELSMLSGALDAHTRACLYYGSGQLHSHEAAIDGLEAKVTKLVEYVRQVDSALLDVLVAMDKREEELRVAVLPEMKAMRDYEREIGDRKRATKRPAISKSIAVVTRPKEPAEKLPPPTKRFSLAGMIGKK